MAELYDENFLTYLKQKHPYLYDVEMQVRRVQDQSGFGDVSMILQILNGVVEKAEVLGSTKRIYYRRVNNKLERLDIPINID